MMGTNIDRVIDGTEGALRVRNCYDHYIQSEKDLNEAIFNLVTCGPDPDSDERTYNTRSIPRTRT